MNEIETAGLQELNKSLVGFRRKVTGLLNSKSLRGPRPTNRPAAAGRSQRVASPKSSPSRWALVDAIGSDSARRQLQCGSLGYPVKRPLAHSVRNVAGEGVAGERDHPSPVVARQPARQLLDEKGHTRPGVYCEVAVKLFRGSF